MLGGSHGLGIAACFPIEVLQQSILYDAQRTDEDGELHWWVFERSKEAFCIRAIEPA
jgi:hypothetical protein